MGGRIDWYFANRTLHQMKKGENILIAAAVDDEIALLIKYFQRPREGRIGGRKIIYGKIAGNEVAALVTGPGIVNCVQSLTCAVETVKPVMIIQTGCAGAFRQSGLGVGDIGIADHETDVYLGLEPSDPQQAADRSCLQLVNELPFPIMIKGDTAYKNHYPSDMDLVNRAFELIANSFGEPVNIKKGPFITVSTITATDQRANLLYYLFKPCMESMEGSAAAHLCLYYDLAFLQIRGASNLVGNRNRNDWLIPQACDRACRAVYEIIRNFHPHISEKSK
jgi:futalosine hydrolase